MATFVPLPRPKLQDMLKEVTIDDEITKFFPAGAKVLRARPHGVSFWTQTCRIDLKLPAGQHQSIFLKLAKGPVGQGMLSGEYHGVKELHRVISDHVPRPIGHGTYASDPSTHFYLSDFIDMTEGLQDMSRFCEMYARLHKDSTMLPDAPSRFGFHTVTYEGSMYQDVTWCDTWEEAFARQLRAFLDQEEKSHGPSEELAELLPALFQKVNPRLLRPLQAHGRVLKPTLLHGDLWYGNIGCESVTGRPVVFDPAVFWGHNEYDCANMDIPRYKLGRECMEEYQRHFPKSAPESDYDDRIKLYGIRANLCASTLYTHVDEFRQLAIDAVRDLVEKFPHGYKGQRWL